MLADQIRADMVAAGAAGAAVLEDIRSVDLTFTVAKADMVAVAVAAEMEMLHPPVPVVAVVVDWAELVDHLLPAVNLAAAGTVAAVLAVEAGAGLQRSKAAAGTVASGVLPIWVGAETA